LTVEIMLLKITQLLKERLKQIRNMNARQVMDADFLKSFLIVLAITVLSYEATDFFYKVIRFPLTKQAVAVTGSRVSSAAENHQSRQLQDYEIITGRNLFHSTLKAAAGNESEGGLFDDDQKMMDFDLKGTVACNSSFGFIVVEERGKKQKLYRLGDKIGSHKLVKITRNTATLKNGEREITLKIKETVQGSLLPNTPGPGRGNAAGGFNPGRGNAAGRFNPNMKAGNENLNNLESIMNQAVVRPVMNKGVQEGYIISNIAPNSLYEKVGLQNGDIIIDVNNNHMQNANDILQVLNSMQSGGSLDMNIKRRGKNETINYSIE